MNYSPNLRILASFGLYFTDSGRGLLTENYLVFESPDKVYKLIWWDGRLGCLSKKLAVPGPPNKNWFNERPTDEVLCYLPVTDDLTLRNLLTIHLPAPDLFTQAFESAFAALAAKVDAIAAEGAQKARNHFAQRMRAGHAWSSDVYWLLRRVLTMREQGYITPEVCIWACYAAARNSPGDPRGERNTTVAEVTWLPHLNSYRIKANPIRGQFCITDFSPQMRLAAVIDRRPTL